RGVRAGPAGGTTGGGGSARRRARPLPVRRQRRSLGSDQGRGAISLPVARGEEGNGDRARAGPALPVRLRARRHRILRGAGALGRRPREVGGDLPARARGRPALHRSARRSRPHPHQARADPGGAARAAGGARREEPRQPGGLDAQGRARGARAARVDRGSLVSIGHVIRRLRREAPTWRATALALVADQWHDPFRVLIACLLSLRTKDETTGPAASRLFPPRAQEDPPAPRPPRLFALADTPERLRRLPPRTIERAIYPVGFYRTKARVLGDVSRDLIERFGGTVPDEIDALLTLKGVGRKTANLVVTQGFNKPGICVDVHVHRISNRWGYVSTRTPEETEMALRRRLPRRYWIGYNDLLVSFGQNVCLPVSPHCSRCPIRAGCPRKGVRRSR